LVVTLPLVAVIGAVIFVAWRFMGLRVWQLVVCLVFGFLLAATTAAPTIHHLITVIVRQVTHS
jgi:hypothetical protein